MDLQSFLTVTGVADPSSSSGSLPPTPSSVANSADFPGTAGIHYLETNNDDQIVLGTAGFTVTGFIRPTFLSEVGANRTVMCKGTLSTAATHVFTIYIDFLDRLSFAISDGAVNYTVQSAALTDNTWAFFSVTYNATTDVLSMSINRGVATTTTSVPDPQDIVANFRIGGAQSVGSDNFLGQESLFGIWTRVLTSTELDELYHSGTGILYADLQAGTKVGVLAYFELDESSNGSGAVIRADSNGGSNDIGDPGHIPSSLLVPN